LNWLFKPNPDHARELLLPQILGHP